MKKCIIKTQSGRDYYNVGALDYYWDSLIKHLGDTVELIKAESVGKKYKRLAYTVEVKDYKKFEKEIKKSVFDNWVFLKSYSVKQIRKAEKNKKIQAKIYALYKEIEKENLKLF